MLTHAYPYNQLWQSWLAENVLTYPSRYHFLMQTESYASSPKKKTTEYIHLFIFFIMYFILSSFYFFSHIHTFLSRVRGGAVMNIKLDIGVRIISKRPNVTEREVIDTLISNHSWLYEGFWNGSASVYYPLYLQMMEDNVPSENVEPDLLIPLFIANCQESSPAEIIAGWCIEAAELGQKISHWGKYRLKDIYLLWQKNRIKIV